MSEKPNLDTSFVWYADLERARSELSKVSGSFCLAKWLQVTLHLHKGTTHSCHHPPTHPILPTDIADNPSGLHNTAEKMEQRKALLAGERPKPCEYCWNIETQNAAAVSDRIMKSSQYWAYPFANDVVASGTGKTINPRYVEVSFSHVCNFKCSYCSADYSSKWQSELAQYGPYTSGNGGQWSPVIEEEQNIYIEAFWKWWPTLKNDLRVFRITGGEPLLSKNTWKFLEKLEEDSLPELQLAINSNLGTSTELIEKLVSKVRNLLDKGKISGIQIYTSIDSFGEDAELIRNGLNCELFFKHVEILLSEIPQLQITIMATYSTLSVFRYTDLLKKVFEIRKRYINPSRRKPLGINTSYLRYPEHLSVKALNQHLIRFPQESLDFMSLHPYDEVNYPEGFTEYEVNSMKNLIDFFNMPIEDHRKQYLREHLTIFFSEHDARRGTSSTELVKRALE